MAVLFEEYEPTQPGTFQINEEITIQVMADEARLKVKDWLLDEVSYMMGVERPTLIVNSHVTWRVPVIFTASTHGKVGEVGFVDVDAKSGEMDTSVEKAEAICVAARKLSEQLPPFKLFSVEDIPPECLSEYSSQIPVLQWPDDSDEPLTLAGEPYYQK